MSEEGFKSITIDPLQYKKLIEGPMISGLVRDGWKFESVMFFRNTETKASNFELLMSPPRPSDFDHLKMAVAPLVVWARRALIAVILASLANLFALVFATLVMMGVVV